MESLIDTLSIEVGSSASSSVGRVGSPATISAGAGRRKAGTGSG